MIRIGYMKALPAALAAVGLFAGAAYAQGNSTVQSNSMGGPNATHTARDIPSATGRSESTKKSNLSHSDRKFIEDAAKGGMAEVELAKIAQERASSPEVKQFAQQMERDHSQANEKIRQLAQEKGVTMPTGPKLAQNHEASKLMKKQGQDFDREYMDYMVKDHQKDVKEFKKQAEKAKDPDVKSFAQETAPKLEHHLQMAENADAAVGGKQAKNAGKNDKQAKNTASKNADKTSRR
jgi:putative membrane protein